jgi:hypothetical protein
LQYVFGRLTEIVQIVDRQEDDRDRACSRIRPKPPHDFQSRDLRHHQIEQDQARKLLLGESQSLLSAFRLHEVILLAEGRVHELQEDGVVIDGEDALFGLGFHF